MLDIIAGYSRPGINDMSNLIEWQNGKGWNLIEMLRQY